MAGFQEGGGGGGGGAGGGLFGGGSGGSRGGWIGGGRKHTWDTPFGSDARTEQAWDKPKIIEAALGIPRAIYRKLPKPEKKAVRHQAKLAVLQERQLQQPKAKRARRIADLLGALGQLQRSAEFWALPGRERNPMLRAARRENRAGEPIEAARSTQPQRGTTQRTPGSVGDAALEDWLQILLALREWWDARERAKAAEREARRQRRADAMSLGDVISGIGSGFRDVLTAAAPVATAIYNERAARELVRAGSTGASGVPMASSLLPATLPTATGAAAVLGTLLGGQPGAMEEGGILEGLESDIEREVSLWRRASGVGGRVSPVRTVFARHPQTGSIAAWGYLGKPVLYTGDLATCKRVRKIARRSAAGVGLRFRASARRRR